MSTVLGTMQNYSSIGANASATVRTGGGRIRSIMVANRNAAVRYFQVYDNTAASGTLILQIPVPATTGFVQLGDVLKDQGWGFVTGMTWSMSTAAGSSTPATASETDVMIQWQK